MRSPLIELEAAREVQVFAKLENLQAIGSFKLRGAGNALVLAGPAALARGVYTASAGNMAQGVAWNARRRGIECAVIVPDHAPATKLDAIDRLGARIVKVPFSEWWQVLIDHGHPDFDGLFIHPFADPAVIAGNGTIGLEIVEDAGRTEAVIVPWGGGGLSIGIASANDDRSRFSQLDRHGIAGAIDRKAEDVEAGADVADGSGCEDRQNE